MVDMGEYLKDYCDFQWNSPQFLLFLLVHMTF